MRATTIAIAKVGRGITLERERAIKKEAKMIKSYNFTNLNDWMAP